MKKYLCFFSTGSRGGLCLHSNVISIYANPHSRQVKSKTSAKLFPKKNQQQIYQSYTVLKHFLSSELALAVSSTFWHTAACMFQLTPLGPIGGLTVLPTYCDKLWFAFRVTDRRFVNIQLFFKGPPFPNIFISTFCILLYISQMEM